MNIISEALISAIEAASLAGDIMLAGLDSKLHIDDKGSSNNLVTQIDTACEKAIVAHLRKTFPDHDFLGEEAQYPKTDSPWIWVIDPLDGTTNYIKGIRHFSTSIALVRKSDERPVAGVVYNPVSTECYYATEGGGAWLKTSNEAPLRLKGSQVQDLKKSLLITGFYYDRGEPMKRTLRQIEAFLSLGILDIRRFGSAALDICSVAAGRADGFWEHTLHPWDFAAAILLAYETGAVVSNYDGGALGIAASSILVAPPAMYQQIKDIVTSV